MLAVTSILKSTLLCVVVRVILRSSYVGNQCITHSQYKQMVGRAGRSGFCDVGESILMFKDHEKERVYLYVIYT